MVALTGGQELIFAVVILVGVVWALVSRALRREPPLPHASRRLRKELERIPYEEDE
jgi:hypothetical protein